jgi:hypothetical protein
MPLFMMNSMQMSPVRNALWGMFIEVRWSAYLTSSEAWSSTINNSLQECLDYSLARLLWFKDDFEFLASFESFFSDSDTAFDLKFPTMLFNKLLLFKLRMYLVY